jgi:uncharacterized cupin superfamily protein
MSVVTLSEHPTVHSQYGRWQALNEPLGLSAFGMNAIVLDPGEDAQTEHDESDADQQEAYVVVAGRAEFRIGDETIEAPAGTVVAVPDPNARRGFTALEPGTRILCIGAPLSAPRVDYGTWISESA